MLQSPVSDKVQKGFCQTQRVSHAQTMPHFAMHEAGIKHVETR